MKLAIELDEINSIDRHVNGSKLQPTPTVDLLDLTVFDFVPESTLSPEQMEKAILELKKNENNILVPYRMNNENAMTINGPGPGVGPKVGNGVGIGIGGGNKGQVKGHRSATELAQEVKMQNLRAHIATHEHQIGQLQRDNSKRLESYEHLKQKCSETIHGLQEQLYGIERQVQSLQNNSIDNQAVLERLNNCEVQNTQHEAEFSLVNDVIVGACSRMDAIEERQRAQWEYVQKQYQSQQIQIQHEYTARQVQQCQQSHSQSQSQGQYQQGSLPYNLVQQQYFRPQCTSNVDQFKQTNFQAEMEPLLPNGSRHSCRKRRSEIETDSTPASKPKSASPSSSSTSSNSRSNCHFCNKSLTTGYLKIHAVYHCPKRPSPK